jgi:hypothetical protein
MRMGQDVAYPPNPGALPKIGRRRELDIVRALISKEVVNERPDGKWWMSAYIMSLRLREQKTLPINYVASLCGRIRNISN